MEQSFLAYRLHLIDGKTVGKMETLTRNGPEPGELRGKVEYSSINYKAYRTQVPAHRRHGSSGRGS